MPLRGRRAGHGQGPRVVERVHGRRPPAWASLLLVANYALFSRLKQEIFGWGSRLRGVVEWDGIPAGHRSVQAPPGSPQTAETSACEGPHPGYESAQSLTFLSDRLWTSVQIARGTPGVKGARALLGASCLCYGGTVGLPIGLPAQSLLPLRLSCVLLCTYLPEVRLTIGRSAGRRTEISFFP